MFQNKRIKYFALFIGLLLSNGSCVTPVTPQLNGNDSNPFLVVEGQITDRVGPFKVWLTKSVPVSISTNPSPVYNADVRILDDQGHSYQLFFNGDGSYITNEKNLKGIPGNKYTLMVTTPDDGLQYTSVPVLMQEVPDIDSLYWEQVSHPLIIEGKVYEDNWMNILLDAHDTQGTTKYWRWEYEETYEVLKKLSEFTWERCWISTPSTTILIANTAIKPVDEVKGFNLRSIGPSNPQLNVRYSILVRQYSIDADLYNYLKLLKDVNENAGGIYGKIPAPVYGNITCSNGTAKALGYFTASSVKEKRLFISRSENYQMETIVYEGPCGSYMPPSFW